MKTPSLSSYLEDLRREYEAREVALAKQVVESCRECGETDFDHLSQTTKVCVACGTIEED